ncbi:His-Xaa-Ser system protein HxsD [Pseudobutyrivibrio sp.]|uniref:His-Xaa-Ser system protein HxsD n=1 Tax=Pseudobutyrivibrio sp. TaxID=2014367 RepID=UPI0025D48D9D|nr:His-Xaa-Ser system protein HxsD [Pseudobutyrivibrio sp.]
MTVKYPDDLYPKEVLIKAAYRYIDQAYIHIDKDQGNYIVSIIPKDGACPISEGEFDNEMLSQAARYIISVRTKNIREITLARAMASTIIEEDSPYEPTEDITNVDDILKDWFDNE